MEPPSSSLSIYPREDPDYILWLRHHLTWFLFDLVARDPKPAYTFYIPRDAEYKSHEILLRVLSVFGELMDYNLYLDDDCVVMGLDYERSEPIDLWEGVSPRLKKQ